MNTFIGLIEQGSGTLIGQGLIALITVAGFMIARMERKALAYKVEQDAKILADKVAEDTRLMSENLTNQVRHTGNNVSNTVTMSRQVLEALLSVNTQVSSKAFDEANHVNEKLADLTKILINNDQRMLRRRATEHRSRTQAKIPTKP